MMDTDVHTAYRTLGQSQPFQHWQKAHKEFFLAHVIPDGLAWQFGFYSAEQNKMAVFMVRGEHVDVIPEQEVARAKQEILPLDINAIKLEAEKALAIARDVIAKKFPAERIVQELALVQNVAKHGTVYNITFFTARLQGINVKLSSTDGNVLHVSAQNVLG